MEKITLNQATLKPGDFAPDFTLPSSEEKAIRLYRQLETQPVVLFFFVRAFTPVCISEVCGFQSQIPQFEGVNAAVFGISSDSSALANRFGKSFKLGYPLLSDPDGRVRTLYRVPKLLGILPGRSTFVIGQDQRIAHVTHSNTSGRIHVEESLRFLEAR